MELVTEDRILHLISRLKSRQRLVVEWWDARSSRRIKSVISPNGINKDTADLALTPPTLLGVGLYFRKAAEGSLSILKWLS